MPWSSPADAELRRRIVRLAVPICAASLVGALARSGGGPVALDTVIAIMNIVGLVVLLPLVVRLVKRRAESPGVR